MIAKRIPPISIGLPVYNAERYLEETLISILSQTYNDFTLIISDNCSTDRTQEICQTYAAQDTRIQFFGNEENVGSAKNFNRVFSLSESKFFKWAASDDLIAPEFLTVCLDILDNEPEVILSYPKARLIDPAGEDMGTYEDGLNMVSTSPHVRFLQVYHNISLANTAFGLIRSEALKKTNLFGNYPHSDLLFLAELSLYGQFREVPQYLFYRRLHPGSVGGASLSGRKIISAKTDDDRLEYYDPGNKEKSLTKKHHLFLKYLKVIQRAPIPFSSKVLLFNYFFTLACIIISKRLYNKITSR